MIAIGLLMVIAGWAMSKFAARLFLSDQDIVLMLVCGKRTFDAPAWYWVPRAVLLGIGWPLLLAGVGLWLWRMFP